MPTGLIVKGELGACVECEAGEKLNLADGENVITVEGLRKSHQQFVTELENNAFELGKAKAGDDAQLDAQAKLDALSGAFPDDPKFAISAFVDGLSVQEAKAQKCDSLQKELQAEREARKAAEKQPAAVFSDGEQAADESKPPGDSLQAEWDKSEELQAEFGDFETFKAFRNADDAGVVSVFNRK